jgi:hypothetical protein
MVEVPEPATTPLSVVTIIWVVVIAMFVVLDDLPPHPAHADSMSINIAEWPGNLCFRIYRFYRNKKAALDQNSPGIERSPFLRFISKHFGRNEFGPSTRGCGG